MKYKNTFHTYHGISGQRMLILPLSVVGRMERDVLFRDFYIHSMGHMPNARNQNTERPDGAPEFILIYCTAGKGRYELNGQEYPVAENQAFILPPNKPHSYEADKDDPWSIYWVHFKGEKAAFLASGFERPVDVAPDFKYRISLFDEAYRALKKGCSNQNLMHACLTVGHFISSFRDIGLPASPPETKDVGEFSASVTHWATHYMNACIDKPLKLKDISAYTGYSARHLNRLFLSETGYAPMEYFQHLKMERACEYLSGGSYTVTQVARILGFKDSGYFSKLFIKVKGVSPSGYRKEAGKR